MKQYKKLSIKIQFQTNKNKNIKSYYCKNSNRKHNFNLQTSIIPVTAVRCRF